MEQFSWQLFAHHPVKRNWRAMWSWVFCTVLMDLVSRWLNSVAFVIYIYKYIYDEHSNDWWWCAFDTHIWFYSSLTILILDFSFFLGFLVVFFRTTQWTAAISTQHRLYQQLQTFIWTGTIDIDCQWWW